MALILVTRANGNLSIGTTDKTLGLILGFYFFKMIMSSKHILSRKTPLEKGNRLNARGKDPRFLRDWEVSVGETSLGTVNDIHNGYNFEGELTQGDGPWTFTITVTNNSDAVITLGGTVNEEIDTQNTYTHDDSGFGGELSTGGATDSFTVVLTDETGIHVGQFAFTVDGEDFDITLDITVLSGEGGGR